MSIRSGFSPRWNQYFVEMHQNSSLTQYILIKSYQIILESLVLLLGYINFYKKREYDHISFAYTCNFILENSEQDRGTNNGINSKQVNWLLVLSSLFFSCFYICSFNLSTLKQIFLFKIIHIPTIFSIFNNISK